MKIEREFRAKVDGQIQRETIAELPERTGNYNTDVGEIFVKICPPCKGGKMQKVIFEGKIMEKGGKGRSSLRRVVRFPYPKSKKIRQNISQDETLIFVRDFEQTRS